MAENGRGSEIRADYRGKDGGRKDSKSARKTGRKSPKTKHRAEGRGAWLFRDSIADQAARVRLRAVRRRAGWCAIRRG